MLVDDHEVVRIGLRAVFGQAANLEIVAEAGTVAEAVAEAARTNPDVVLMDMRLPDGTGIDACREIRSANPSIHVLFLTSYSDEEAILATILAGGAGYLLKEIDSQALLSAIGRVAKGETILDPKMTETALNALTRSPLQAKTQNPDALSIQERRILSLVVEGKTNKEIAARMGLSDKTVKNYLSNAFQKLGVNRRAHAAAVYSSLRGTSEA
jgi:DNA-binding NarL/FixJ family response regulator